MRSIYVTLVFAVAFELIFPLSTQAGETNKITVTGSAEVERKPDVAYVTLYIKAEGILMEDAVKRASEKSKAIQKALRDTSKKLKGIEIIDFELGAKSREYWRSDKQDEPPRPEVFKRIRITLPPDPKLAPQTIDTAIREGAIMKLPSSTHYSGEYQSVVLYGLLDYATAELEAKKAALANAKKKAEQTARLVGKKVGDVLAVGSSGFPPCSQVIYVSGRKMKFPTKYISASPDKVVVSASFSVTYELLK